MLRVDLDLCNVSIQNRVRGLLPAFYELLHYTELWSRPLQLQTSILRTSITILRGPLLYALSTVVCLSNSDYQVISAQCFYSKQTEIIFELLQEYPSVTMLLKLFWAVIDLFGSKSQRLSFFGDLFRSILEILRCRRKNFEWNFQILLRWYWLVTLMFSI